MKILLTCRECGHNESGYSGNGIMNRIKMWNHIKREHAAREVVSSQVRLWIRQDNEAKMEEEAYRLQASY